MNLSHLHALQLCAALVCIVLILPASTAFAEDSGGGLVAVDKLPSIPQLPDPFLFPDGTRVNDQADWLRRRGQIKAMILDYEYGHLPPDPGNVKGENQILHQRFTRR